MGKFKWKISLRGLKRPISPTKHATVADPSRSRQGFTRANTKSNQNLKAQYNNGQSQSPISQQAPPLPSLTNSPSISSTFSEQSGYVEQEPKKFLNEKYAKCSVKGNFLTLAAQPKNVELGEWLAHQLVEMNRLLTGMIQVIQEVDTNTGLPLCNEQQCPTMSAGRLTYTWLENGRPAKIPAPQYIVRVQRWIVGKIHDEKTFPTAPPPTVDQTSYMSGDTGAATPSTATPIAAPPTNLNQPLSTLAGIQDEWIGKSSGFPQHFHSDVKAIIKQMFRCYAHLYHCHFTDPFWHIGRHAELNSCFVHFCTVAMYYDLISRKDMEPLQGLIDIFVAQGVIPKEAVQQHVS
ncbi:uncharacterized protein Z519_09051 [Cladophialophora bantiana CBS 173.52]|uniref:Uncharacterized protein n=1 Tax=Cladophialophora bantiana (strain ATCC 10958 / CBS 173.52 / CDC B-1940 / NIH 8579) TaxID=1442370 RepID=A0A0D2EK73_CLAB1|nr:uncharacterized protein Z519_09051 [Cladophialophora bantiana CBS 173.52]KIW90406.1 hypothetical protein Z519_09051 [Cladophialophora bantiana CBS 173.52]